MNGTASIIRWGSALTLIGAGFFLGWISRPTGGGTAAQGEDRPLAASPGALLPSPKTAPPAPGPPQPFHWSQVESADYLVYIANLRAIGCPELTVRDIIVADVNQLFAPKYAALVAQSPELSWWTKRDKRQPINLALESQIQALNEEKRRLILRLLGPEAVAGVNLPDLNASAVRDQNTWAYLPASKQTELRQILSRYEAMLDRGRVQWKGLSSDDRDAKEKELLDARLNELESLLSPEELREFQLRESTTAQQLKEQFGKGDLSEAEFRTLYTLRAEFEQNNPVPKPEDWKRLESETSRVLGSERYFDIQKQNNPMWRAMQDMAGTQTLSREAMQNAYRIQREYTEKMVQAVGTMFSDPQQDPTPLRNLAAEMDAKLAGILGTETVERLERRGALPRLVVQDDGKRKNYSLSPGGFTD